MIRMRLNGGRGHVGFWGLVRMKEPHDRDRFEGDRAPWGRATHPSPQSDGANADRGRRVDAQSEASARAPIVTAPPVLIWMVGAFWASFALFAVTPPFVVAEFDSLFALSATRFLAGPEANGGVFQMVAPLVGHMFIHADLMHIGVNSLWFLAFGAPVASRLNNAGRMTAGIFEGRSTQRVGSGASLLFIGFFFLCGIGGALTFILLNMSEPALLVGASGGVSGLLGGLVRFIYRRGPMFTRQVKPLAPLTDPVVFIWSAFIVLSNLGVGLFGLGVGEKGPDIAWEAHVGGYFTGLLIYPVFDRLARVGRSA